MALIRFKNLPDTSTPLNAENLNNNFDELNTKIDNKNSNIYSTDETVIGEWTDGKPLYRKCFTTNETLPPYENNQQMIIINHNISNVDLIFVENSYLDNGNGLRFPIVGQYLPQYPDSEVRTGVDVNRSQIRIIATKGGYGANWLKFVSVNYTKTTD